MIILYVLLCSLHVVFIRGTDGSIPVFTSQSAGPSWLALPPVGRPICVVEGELGLLQPGSSTRLPYRRMLSSSYFMFFWNYWYRSILLSNDFELTINMFTRIFSCVMYDV